MLRKLKWFLFILEMEGLKVCQLLFQKVVLTFCKKKNYASDIDKLLQISYWRNQTICLSKTLEQMLIPNTGEGFENLYVQGIKTFEKWDGKMLEKQGKRTPNYSMLIVCWSGKYMQILYNFLIHLRDKYIE